MSVCFDWIQAEVKRGRSLWPQKSEILSHGQGELWQYRMKRAGEDKAGIAGRKHMKLAKVSWEGRAGFIYWC